MNNIRELFHQIGNGHNKISVGAGVAKELLKHENGKIPEETKDMLIKKFSELERHAVEADKVLNKLKDVIYGIIDPDTGKSKK